MKKSLVKFHDTESTASPNHMVTLYIQKVSWLSTLDTENLTQRIRKCQLDGPDIARNNKKMLLQN